MTRYRCPCEPRFPNDLLGCGAEFEAELDEEGLIDCPECGIWFKPELEPGGALAQTA